MNKQTGDSSLDPVELDRAMLGGADPNGTEPERDGPEQTVGESFSKLLADAHEYAAAEADRQKLRAGIFIGGVRDAAILIAMAVMLLFGTLVALLIGLIIALSPTLTPLGAIGAVVGGAIAISLVLLLFAKSRVSRMIKAAKG